MKHLFTLLVLSIAALSTPVFASSHKEAPMMAGAGASAPMMSKQQSKMGTCNASAADKKGDERKAFMKECLSNKPTQQDKMKSCNVDASGKKGDERKAFMKECLSK